MQLLKKSLCPLLFFFCFLNNISYADCDIENVVFGISNEDITFLHYFYYQNIFDNSTVDYTFGEVRIYHDSTVSRVYLSWNLSVYDGKVQGDSTQGEDQTLLNLGTTNTFTMPELGQVSFFRSLKAYRPCGSTGNNGGDNSGGTGTWEDQWWAVGAENIPETTEFVMQLVRVQDDSVLADIDSVGVAPNLEGSALARRYGTTPDRMNHIRELPGGHSGEEAYIRISPRRYGPTPYGLFMRKIHNYFSYSTIFEYDSTGMHICSQGEGEFLDSMYFAEVIEYCDSVVAADGFLSKFYSGYFTSQAQSDYFMDRYYEPYIKQSGDTIWITKHSGPSYSHVVKSLENEYKINSNGNVAKIMKISPMPNPGKSGNMDIFSKLMLNNVIIKIYNIANNESQQIWKGNLSEGTNDLTLDFSHFVSGTYIVVLVSQNNELMHYKKLLITR